MSTAVITVVAGGLPVVELAAGKLGLPVTEATNGRGIAVTKVVGMPGLPVVFDTIGVLPPVTYATFDNATLSNATLSNGNLTATHANTVTNSGARSASAKSSGKFYFEIQVVTGHGSFDFMGLILTTGAYSDLVGGTKCTAISRGGGSINSNNIAQGISMAAFADGSIMGMAVDLDARLAWFRKGAVWNAGGAANPATGTGGVIVAAGSFMPFVSFAGTGTAANDAYTINCGASAFSGAVPAGFTSGWPAP
jgi:hypothetical protein